MTMPSRPASARASKTVGVVFGGRSVEHDVSIVTGHQTMQALESAGYTVVPLYIDRDGRWLTGEPLKAIATFTRDAAAQAGVRSVVLSPSAQHHGILIDPTPRGLTAKPQLQRLDVVFPTIHGSHGEDGTLQGLLELADIPYVGCGVLASAVCNDKAMTKAVLQNAGIPVVEGVTLSRTAWRAGEDAIVAQVTAALAYPLFVKPATLGSSIGIGRADDEGALRRAIGLALNFDARVLVEKAVTDAVEINCAVLGRAGEAIASPLEQPVGWGEYLSFEAKYLHGRGGMKTAERVIPAPIPADAYARIQQLALEAFTTLHGAGLTRFDFFYRERTGEIFLNEPNTLPGSLALYLWAEMGMTPAQVVSRLVETALAVHAEKRATLFNYQTSLVSLTASRGLKGAKGKARAPRPAE
jgi:D-alanine-D-alanine ligase